MKTFTHMAIAAAVAGLVGVATSASAATITFANLAQADIPAPEISYTGGAAGTMDNTYPFTGLFTVTLKSGFTPTVYNNVSMKFVSGFVANGLGTQSGGIIIQPLSGGTVEFYDTKGTASGADDDLLLVGNVGAAQFTIYTSGGASTGSQLSSTDITWTGPLTAQFPAAGLGTTDGSYSLSLTTFLPPAAGFTVVQDFGSVQLGYLDAFTATVTGSLVSAVVPVPGAAAAGLALMGGMGAFAAVRRRLRR